MKKSVLNEALEWSCLSEMKSCEFASATMVDNCALNCIFGNLYLQPPCRFSEIGARNSDLKVNYRVAMSPTSTLRQLQLDSGD